MAKKEVYRSVKLSDNINPAELHIADQIRLLFSKVSNSDEAELDARLKLNSERLKRVAALRQLLETAVEKMNKLNESQVSIGVSSEFLPYINEVVDTRHGMGRYYNIQVYKKDLPQSVRHRFLVVIKKKVSEGGGSKIEK